MQVSMAEAAERLNVSVDTIRRRLHKGELKGTQEPTPQGYRWRIYIPDDPKEAPRNDPSNAYADARADATLVALTTAVDALQRQLEAQNQQIDQLHHLLAQTALNSAPAKPWWRFWN